MGARERSVAVEASEPASSPAGGRDASSVFTRSSLRSLESARARQRRHRRPEVSGETLLRRGWGVWGKEAGLERKRGGVWASFYLGGLLTVGQRVAEDRAGSKGRASAPSAPDSNQVSTLRSSSPMPTLHPPTPVSWEMVLCRSSAHVIVCVRV